jgi:hypothetical protein
MIGKGKGTRGFVIAALLAVLSVVAAPAHAAPVRPAVTIAPNLTCPIFIFVLGSCQVAPTGGVAPYTQSWNGGPATSDTSFELGCIIAGATLLTATVVVTDSVGNTGSATAQVFCVRMF